MRLALPVAVLLAIGLALPGGTAGQRSCDASGVTRTSILLGGTVPITGPESAYAPIARGAEAYFKWINSRGGVRGRLVCYRFVDDGYEVPRTVQATRRLIQQDGVFAVFNTIGTEHALAIRPLLNQLRIPQLFVGSGSGEIAGERRRYPWTMGYLPSFTGEGRVFGRFLARTRPRARMAVLHEDSEYGRELLAGLRSGLGRRSRIVATETYEVTDVTVASQVAQLKSSGADTFLILALPKQALQAFVSADRLGWRPRQVVVTSVSIDPFVMEVARLNTRGRLTEGAVSMAFLKDPTDPRLARDAGVRLYRTIMRRYLPREQLKAVAHFYGMAVARTMVTTIRRAGRNLTRPGLLRAATHLRERDNPFLRRGIVVRTSPQDYYPIEQAQLLRYRGGRWVPFGPLVSTR